METEIDNAIENIGNEQILDYGEKCIKPGESLQMPIVKIGKNPDDPKSFIVVRVSCLFYDIERNIIATFRISSSSTIWKSCGPAQQKSQISLALKHGHSTVMMQSIR